MKEGGEDIETDGERNRRVGIQAASRCVMSLRLAILMKNIKAKI